MSRKNNNKISIWHVVCLMLILFLVGFVIILLTNHSETRISSSFGNVETSALECRSTGPKDPFFVSKKAQRFEHVLRLIFKEDRVVQLSYDYNGVYNNEQVARDAEAAMHTDYNKYMNEIGVNAERLSPNFTAVKSKVKMSLYLDFSNVSSKLMPIFFMNDEDYNRIDKLGNADFKTMFEEKGFTCTAMD